MLVAKMEHSTYSREGVHYVQLGDIEEGAVYDVGRSARGTLTRKEQFALLVDTLLLAIARKVLLPYSAYGNLILSDQAGRQSAKPTPERGNEMTDTATVPEQETEEERASRSQMYKHEDIVAWLTEEGKLTAESTQAETIAAFAANRNAYRKTDRYRQLVASHAESTEAQRAEAQAAREAAKAEKAAARQAEKEAKEAARAAAEAEKEKAGAEPAPAKAKRASKKSAAAAEPTTEEGDDPFSE
jgi:hypothetical protein